MKFAGCILFVADVKATLSFYEKAFGLKTRFVSDDATYGDVETDGPALGFASLAQARNSFPGGVQGAPRSMPPQASEVWLTAPDVEAAYKQAVKAGCVPVAKPKKKPWGQVASFVRDLDGHLVEVSEPWPPA